MLQSLYPKIALYEEIFKEILDVYVYLYIYILSEASELALGSISYIYIYIIVLLKRPSLLCFHGNYTLYKF